VVRFDALVNADVLRFYIDPIIRDAFMSSRGKNRLMCILRYNAIFDCYHGFCLRNSRQDLATCETRQVEQ